MNLFSKYLLLFLLTICGLSHKSYTQPTWTINPFGNEKKPKKYEEKKLPSELTDVKKFTPVRKFIQNTTSRYNYYFNASQKINAVIAAATASHEDNYATLLSFYPYSVKESAAQATQLDSVIYITTAGILLHDLRSDWVDNMYLLIGKSYFLKNELDSAALTFQFINYNLQPRKKDEDDYGRVVGGNGTADRGALSIANTEKQKMLKKITGLPPSRNDALIWLIRTHIEQNEFADAAGLINILQQDKNLPQRLRNDLEEVNAFWFYAQSMYDSSARHLQYALNNADTKDDLSRREYLLAQMLERTGQIEQASKYYALAGKHTADPVLEIFAGLSDAKMLRQGGNEKELQNAIARLLKMAKKDKYDGYQDIILYSSAQLSLQQPDTLNAFGMLAKSVTYPVHNAGYKNAAFVQLADLSYGKRAYRDASRYYDSLALSTEEEATIGASISERKEILSRLVAMIDIVEKEDSLQRIASLSPADRDAFIKKLVKQYRKLNGLVEEESSGTDGGRVLPNTPGGQLPDLFPDNSRGEFYFYNASLRSRGFSEFKSKWGKRDNTDNWRRKAAGKISIAGSPDGGNMTDPNVSSTDPKGKDGSDPSGGSIPYSYDALLGGLPLTPEALETSNTAISTNLLSQAKLFQNELKDYPQAILAYEEYLRRFKNTPAAPDAYMGLAYSYNKIGNTIKANENKQILMTQYAGSSQANMISNPEMFSSNKKNAPATKQYEEIYNMFVEGNFEQALKAKRQADAQYGTNFWSPQLLYIEAIYYIKEKQDSVAITTLNNLISLYPKSPLADKAATMMSVLSRRAEIENYLTKLDVTRVQEDKVIMASETPAPIKQIAPTVPTQVVVKAPIAPTTIVKADSTITTPKKFISGNYKLDPLSEHYVIMVLNKVDPVYVNEAKNALNRVNKSSGTTSALNTLKDVINPENSVIIIGNLADATAALTYYNSIKKAAPREMPWLPAAKYSFFIITPANYQVLKEKKELQSYKDLLNANYNNIF